MQSVFEKYPKELSKQLLDNKCSLCSILERETPIVQNNLVFLVPTKDMKGHKIRFMVVTKRHVKEPSFEELTECYIMLFRYADLVKDNCFRLYVISGLYASVPEHFHIMCCDDECTEEEYKQLQKTPKVEFL